VIRVTALLPLFHYPESTMSHASNEQQDRRVTSRFSGSISCSFCCGKGFYSGIVKNLSIDGAFVASDDSPPQGSIGNLVFKSEGGVLLRVPSRVVHAEESSQFDGFGVYFLYFGEKNLELLEGATSG